MTKVKTLFIKAIILLSFFISFSNADSVWNRTNLYDSTNDSYYIPYELWTGAKWDGKKELRFHNADLNFMGNKSIIGPKEFYHEKVDKNIQVYERTNKGKVQLFTFYDFGIGRVYDNRKERYFDGGAKFPAGFGWKLHEIKEFSQTEWKKGNEKVRTLGIKIVELKFNDENNLESMTYEFYVKGDLDHTYTYEPNKGMISLEKN